MQQGNTQDYAAMNGRWMERQGRKDGVVHRDETTKDEKKHTGKSMHQFLFGCLFLFFSSSLLFEYLHVRGASESCIHV
jgi:hypothetical protein